MSAVPKLVGWRAILFASSLLFCQSTSVSSPVTPELGASTYHPHFAFDLASIREYRRGDGTAYANMPHNSLYHAEGAELIALILDAYDLNATQLLENLPSWADTTRYTITAKSDPSTDEALAKLSDSEASAEKHHMLQLLLSERFHLQIHPEVRTAKTYELITTPRTATLMTPVHGDVAKTVSTCSPHFSRGKGADVDSKGCPFHILFSTLQLDLGTVILDRTGMTGMYAYHLMWWPQLTWSPTQLPQGDEDRYPALTDALREQLGLELKQTKGPVTFWVVDHIERPTPN